jgi:ATP-dependent phosphoenolpyruvate carboxykinase
VPRAQIAPGIVVRRVNVDELEAWVNGKGLFGAGGAVPADAFEVMRIEAVADIEVVQEAEDIFWLVNTGWTGGPYGTGHRIDIASTRAMVRAALNGELDDVQCRCEPIFALDVPERVPGVEDQILRPRDTWPNAEAYERQARRLASMFTENFSNNFAGHVSKEIAEAGPRAQ